MQKIFLQLPLIAGLVVCSLTGIARENKLHLNTASNSRVFVANAGQIMDQNQHRRTDIDFRIGLGTGLNAFLGPTGISYQWVRLEEQSVKVNNTHNEDQEDQKQYTMYRMDVTVVGANRKAKIITEQPGAYREQYYQPWITSDPNRPVTAASCNKVTYKDIYPNIDWVVYITPDEAGSHSSKVKYDFVVRPGGNVKDIQLQYSGTTALNLHKDGSLSAVTPVGLIGEEAPVSYTQEGKAVGSRFVVQHEVVSFDIDQYTGTLIIDPTLDWGSYFGGPVDDVCYSITTDKWGNVYMAGATNSLTNIATTGAHQISFAGGINTAGADAYLSKWDAGGNMIWATYYGGPSVDVANAVTCDTSGMVFLGGYTNSTTGMSTPGSYQPTKAGTIANRHDAFVCKFDTSGNRLWGTYFGGAQNDASVAFALHADAANFLYMTGSTSSTDLPVTPGAQQTSIAGNQDGFVSKFTTEGNIVWSTYHGGNAIDHHKTIHSDSLGNIYIGGYTESTTGIATPGALQGTYGGAQDGFLVKMDSSGSLLWGTYVGGAGIDRIYSLRAQNQSVYVGGLTQSTASIATANSHQPVFAGGTGSDGFLCRYDGNGNKIWATYYGGDKPETIQEIWCNQSGDVYISGEAASTSGIATPGSYKETLGSTFPDIYLAKFSDAGLRIWGTYYGGQEGEIFGFVTGFQSKVTIAGRTNSGSGIATNTTTLNGGYDAFLATFNDCLPPVLPDSIMGNVVLCANDTVLYHVDDVPSAIEYVWIIPDGWLGASDSSSILLKVGNADDTLKVFAISACGGLSDSLTLPVSIMQLPEPVVINNSNFLSTTQSYSSYQWKLNGGNLPGATSPTHVATENGQYEVAVTSNNGCSNTSTPIEISGIVSVTEQKKGKEIVVYPNPFKSSVSIQSARAGKVEIYNSIGQIVLSSLKRSTLPLQVDTKPLVTGIYLLRFTDDEQNVYHIKIVK